MTRQSFCKALKISSRVTTCYPDAMYLNSWAFASLLANLENLSTVKKIFDGDAILTYFVYFLGYLPSLSNNVMGAKGVNVGGS